MWVLETAAVAFSMFSALPMPQFDWNERNMRYALCAFPLIGAVIGLSWWCWTWAALRLGLPVLLAGAVRCALPAVITGGIHLDGYADTQDALASHADPERRQEILKDPHCGAFAVVRLCVYDVVYFALCCSMEPTKTALWCAGWSFVLSRALSGLALTVLPLAKDTGLAHTFATAADKKRVRVFLAVLSLVCAAALCWFGRIAGLGMLAAAGAVFARYARMSKKEFGGVSGDLAGWFLVKTEFWMLAALVLAQYGERLI